MGFLFSACECIDQCERGAAPLGCGHQLLAFPPDCVCEVVVGSGQLAFVACACHRFGGSRAFRKNSPLFFVFFPPTTEFLQKLLLLCAESQCISCACDPLLIRNYDCLGRRHENARVVHEGCPADTRSLHTRRRGRPCTSREPRANPWVSARVFRAGMGILFQLVYIFLAAGNHKLQQ